MDEMDITSATLLVRKPFPVDVTLFTKQWAPDFGIPCKRMKWAKVAGLQEFRFLYEGVAGDTSFAESQQEFELDYGLEAVGIEAHPFFADLLKMYKGTVNKDTGIVTWPQTLPGSPPVPNEMYGTESWEVRGLIWRRTFCSRSLPTSIFRNFGYIDQPEGGEGVMPPELPGRANWRLTEGRARWRGNIWQISKGWTSSGPNGWLASMYTPGKPI